MKQAFVGILLDETGSMLGQETRVVTGINEYIQHLRGQVDDCSVMLTKFNAARYQEVFCCPLEEVGPLTSDDYQPDSMTPLYDSIGRMARRIEKKAGDAQVLFVIDTDGRENYSKEYSKKTIAALIKQKEAGNWTFVFMGAEMDAWAAKEEMGLPIADANTLSYSHRDRIDIYTRVSLRSAGLFRKGESTNKFFGGKEWNETLKKDSRHSGTQKSG